MTINFKLIKKHFEEKILNAYSNSSNSTYSCDYLNNKMSKETILYNNENGNKGENISFSDNPQNYFKIEIIYGAGSNFLNCKTIYIDNILKTARSIPLETFWRDGTNAAGIISSWYTISSTGLTYVDSLRYYYYAHLDKPTIDTINNIYIYKVVGYK